MDEPLRCYDRSTPMREGTVTKSSGMNAYVVWDDGQEGWIHFDDIGAIPPDAV